MKLFGVFFCLFAFRVRVPESELQKDCVLKIGEGMGHAQRILVTKERGFRGSGEGGKVEMQQVKAGEREREE